MPNAAEDHVDAWKPLSTRELRGCATRVEWNWYELAGQPASQFRQPVEMVTQVFCGERSADSRIQRELKFAV